MSLPSGEFLAFDGVVLRRFDSAAVVIGDVATIPADPAYPFVFPSFVTISPDGATALVGRTGCDATFTDCDFGELWSVDLATGGTFLQSALLGGIFDAAFLDTSTAYVTAKPCGFGCSETTVYRTVVGVSGATDVALVPGAPGPVEFDVAGNLLVGTVDEGFPPAPGSSSVLVFPSQSIGGGLLLTTADAWTLAAGLEGASDLAVDDLTGDVFLAVNRFTVDVTGTDVSLNQVQLLRGTDAPILFSGTAGWSLSNLEVSSGDGTARLFPFQPASGGSLSFRSSEFVTFGSVVRQYVPKRAGLTVGASSGTATMSVTAGGAGNIALFLYGPASSVLTTQFALSFANLSHAPYFVGLDLSQVTFDLQGLLLDGQGEGSRAYSVPQSVSAGTYGAQALLLDAGSLPLGTTNVAIL